jgi:cellulose 1,4-beta-cellobiosidase
MDIWEANSQASAYTPHSCESAGLFRCEGDTCGDTDRYTSVCDKDGCDFNSYRMGDKGFLGTGKTVDTSKPMTVVTQFITTDGTDNGDVSEIRRIYVQAGKVIQNSKTVMPGMDGYDSVSNAFCKSQKSTFGDKDMYTAKGGLSRMSASMSKGMVLVMSIWDDHSANMLWLDSNFPASSPPSAPGVARGPCATTSGVPTEVEANSPNSNVKFSNIKYGTIGSTYAH